MTNKIKWGIISTGNISAKFAEALKILPEAELVAVASRDQKTANNFAKKHNIPKIPSSIFMTKEIIQASIELKMH